MKILGIKAIIGVREAYQRYQQAIYTIIDLFNFSLGIIFIMKGCQKQCLKQFVIQSVAKDLGDTFINEDTNNERAPQTMFAGLFRVGLPGFEPGQTEPKPVVLPLHHNPIIMCFP